MRKPGPGDLDPLDVRRRAASSASRDAFARSPSRGAPTCFCSPSATFDWKSPCSRFVAGATSSCFGSGRPAAASAARSARQQVGGDHRPSTARAADANEWRRGIRRRRFRGQRRDPCGRREERSVTVRGRRARSCASASHTALRRSAHSRGPRERARSVATNVQIRAVPPGSRTYGAVRHGARMSVEGGEHVRRQGGLGRAPGGSPSRRDGPGPASRRAPLPADARSRRRDRRSRVATEDDDPRSGSGESRTTTVPDAGTDLRQRGDRSGGPGD